MLPEWPAHFDRTYVSTSLGRLHVVAAGAGAPLLLLGLLQIEVLS